MRKAPVLLCVLMACSSRNDAEEDEDVSKAGSPPARIERRTTLDDLGTVTLSADAEKALAIATARVEAERTKSLLRVGGEVVVASGRDVVLVSPVGGRVVAARRGLPRPGERVRKHQVLFTLVPFAGVDRDVRARAESDLEVAKANVELENQRTDRAEAMVADGSESVRTLEESLARQRTAVAGLESATSRLKTLARGTLDSDITLPVRSTVDGTLRGVHVTAGQSVPSGVILVELAAEGRWIRATFTASNALQLRNADGAFAEKLGGGARVPIVEIEGPPSADPARSTVDRFYLMPSDAAWTPGERVLVDVTVVGAPAEPTLAVPALSVIRDAEGASWVYVKIGDRRYRRRHVEPMLRDGDRILLRRGPSAGSEVVTAGAVELWGFELGADR